MLLSAKYFWEQSSTVQYYYSLKCHSREAYYNLTIARQKDLYNYMYQKSENQSDRIGGNITIITTAQIIYIKSFHFLLLYIYLLGTTTKQPHCKSDDSTGIQIKCRQDFRWNTLSDHLGCLGTYKWNNNIRCSVWGTGFSWLRIASSARLLQNFRFHRWQRILG